LLSYQTRQIQTTAASIVYSLNYLQLYSVIHK
jgi:hypothetical protein